MRKQFKGEKVSQEIVSHMFPECKKERKHKRNRKRSKKFRVCKFPKSCPLHRHTKKQKSVSSEEVSIALNY